MKLLIVDDSVLILKFAEGAIRKNQLNLEIALCTSGEEALQYLEVSPVDIVLLDIVMPGISGVEVLRRIKANPTLRTIEVIMFTSLSDKETLHECFEVGAVDYISKPIDELEYVARIKASIRRKRLEKSALEYMKEIEGQNKSLIQLNSQLKLAQNQIIQQEKMASVGHLAAGIAHEINNPLGFIISNMVTLKKYLKKYQGVLPVSSALLEASNEKNAQWTALDSYIKRQDFAFINEDIEDLFSDTQEGLARVGVIVKGLRNFSRIDQLDEMSPYNINEGIENTLIISRNELKYTADVETDFGQVSEIMGLGGQINQVILNVLLNAAAAIKTKHGSKKGLINIRTWQENQKIYLTIRDNGGGIPTENLQTIFDPFFTTKPIGEGTGLGLSISYDIITHKHKGWIEAKSQLGEWTEFTITLPMIETFE